MTIYDPLDFPPPPADRPYTFLNMVSTIDGKTVSGTRDESVADLGSKADHLLMDRIEAAATAVMLGAQTLRATPGNWNPKSPIRIGVTKSGLVDYDAKFFSAAEARAFIACPASSTIHAPDHVKTLKFGKDKVDFRALVRALRFDLGIERLLCLGGSETNAELLKAELVDELFLTIAPKIKMGRNIPTYAGGEPLPRECLQEYELIEHHTVGDEVFLRYRRRR